MARVAPSSLILWCFFLSAEQIQAADPFLQKKGGSLLADLENALGPGSFQGRLANMENQLRPMFLALPKTSRNLVSHSSARYALHRIIGDVHGWRITALEPNATTISIGSLVGSGVLSALLPPHIEQIFEDYIHVDGLGMQELAIIATTVGHFVHEQQKQTLRAACGLLDVPTLGPITEETMATIIEVYMASFLRSIDVEKIPAELLTRLFASLRQGYPGWTETQMLLADERESVAYNEKGQTNPFQIRTGSFQVALRVVERVADVFALQQAEPECQEIKEELLAYEYGVTGRVRLADFYRADRDSRFFYIESKEYLRALGALDDSDQMWGPKVIVSNYILSKSNCLADSRIYSICCLNECESLYGHLEQSIAAPEATPNKIANLVARLSSSTVQAPRNLSLTTLARLDEIAVGHGGQVLLHSRLFAQWMHQAFPRECPYPHLAGTTTSLNPRDWQAQSGHKYKVDPESFNYTDAITLPLEGDDGTADLMWTFEDEHIVEPRRSMASRVWTAASAIGAYFWRVVFVGLCATLALTAKALTARSGWRGADDVVQAPKFYV